MQIFRYICPNYRKRTIVIFKMFVNESCNASAEGTCLLVKNALLRSHLDNEISKFEMSVIFITSHTGGQISVNRGVWTSL